MSSFCGALTPKISSNHATRDYIQGKDAWRLRPGRGSKLVHSAHRDNTNGSRGGKPPVVKRSALEQVYYGSSAPYHYTKPTCGPIFLLDWAVRVIDAPSIELRRPRFDDFRTNFCRATTWADKFT